MRLDETVVNFTTHRGPQIEGFRILKWGGRYQALGPAYFWLPTRGTTKGYELVKVAAPTRPPFQSYQKKKPQGVYAWGRVPVTEPKVQRLC